MDNYNERWGKQAQLDAFLQAYALEKLRIEARKKGLMYEETLHEADGSVKVILREVGTGNESSWRASYDE